MYGFIYITTNLVNGKQYIGQHKILNNSKDDSYLGSGKLLKMAITNYGKENFQREILEYAVNQDELNELEMYYIWLANATQDENFYNIHIGGAAGDTMSGWDDDRRKQFSDTMSKATKGEANGMYGKKHSEESCRKMSETRKRNYSDPSHYLHSEEFRAKMSEVTKGESNGMHGRKHSDESKRKMSESQKGKTAGEKNGNYGNSGEKAKNGCAVYQWNDKEHTVLAKRHNTMRLALESLGLQGGVALRNAIRGNKLYKGYYWSK